MSHLTEKYKREVSYKQFVTHVDTNNETYYYWKLSLVCTHNVYTSPLTYKIKSPKWAVCSTCVWAATVASVTVEEWSEKTAHLTKDDRKSKANDHHFSGHRNDPNAPF